MRRLANIVDAFKFAGFCVVAFSLLSTQDQAGVIRVLTSS